MPIRYAHRPFDKLTGASWESDYSRMKFGDDSAAKVLGSQLAESFYVAHPTFFDRPVVIIPAPSDSTVAFASSIMAHHMMQRLNLILLRNDRPRVEWTTIHRTQSYYTNYAASTAEERRTLLSKDRLFLNRDYVEGKNLVFVDDCTITGAHEDKVEQFVKSIGLTNIHAFACYAKYIGHNASIEHDLNHTAIVDHRDLLCLIHRTVSSRMRYHLTTRAIRMFMELPVDKFAEAVSRLPHYLREELLYASIQKNYHNHKDYTSNFQLLLKQFSGGLNERANESVILKL